MGNFCTCLVPKTPPVKGKQSQRPAKRLTNPGGPATVANTSNRWSRIRSGSRKEKENFDDALIQEQALAAAILFRQHQQQQNGLGLPFDRSASLRYPNGSSSKKTQLPRSSSSRARSLTDPLLQPHQLLNLNRDEKLPDLETNHFVLVHGGGFGAWCWYKTIALLEEGGFKVTAIDLTGAGIHSFDTNGITSLSQYVKPLTDFLEKLPDAEKTGSTDLMRQAQIFLYANGNNKPPTAIDLDKSLLKELLFNQSPAKDIALASVSMRHIPFAPVLEKLSLSDMKYGSVRRFYIETPEDNAIPIALQQSMINSSPPEKVFRLKGADHSPFFSKPQALHKLLVEISKLPSS
ncbi:putative methylesterase 11 [Citrus sinensis]|uniref:AB hydrolase-1 domain-containing protein n=1 Tax=Citrus clementina TaxID=85681 RepID=V4T4S6_CITCL|nr:hypothetical protein CICLE_v10011905mg [Citrus x clementina]KAH9676798.1 putative methylesterase 11 [Citrus sinensis]